MDPAKKQLPPLNQTHHHHQATVWMRATELLKRREFNQAFKLVLHEGDDIYLLRLLAQTGPVVKFLDDETAYSVVTRVNKIVRSGSLQAMMVEWVEDAYKTGIYQGLSKHEQNEYLDTLYQFGHGDENPSVSGKAQRLYSEIRGSARR